MTPLEDYENKKKRFCTASNEKVGELQHTVLNSMFQNRLVVPCLDFNAGFLELRDVDKLEAPLVPVLERGYKFWAREEDATAEYVEAMEGPAAACVGKRIERRNGWKGYTSGSKGFEKAKGEGSDEAYTRRLAAKLEG